MQSADEGIAKMKNETTCVDPAVQIAVELISTAEVGNSSQNRRKRATTLHVLVACLLWRKGEWLRF